MHRVEHDVKPRPQGATAGTAAGPRNRARERSAAAKRPAARQPAKRVVRDRYEGRDPTASQAAKAEQERAQLARAERWRLRDGARGLTTLDRLKHCGIRRAYGVSAVAVRLSVETGRAGYAGLQSCGSVWACPVCQTAIRSRRAEETRQALQAHVERGGGLLFGTLTVRHKARDPLQRGFDGVAGAWRAVQQDKGLRAFRRSYPFGFVRAIEVLDGGANGWHPHMHLVVLTETEWSEDVRESFGALVHAAWVQAAKRLTGRTPDDTHGTRFERAHDPRQAAEYLTKLQEDERQWDAAAELTRADAKRGRRGSMHPLALLELAIAGDPVAYRRWREYEEATRGRKCLQWSQGLKAKLLPGQPELSDEELAAQEETGTADVVGWLLPADFAAVRRSRLMLTMLSAVEANGLRGFWSVLHRARRIARRSGWHLVAPERAYAAGRIT